MSGKYRLGNGDVLQALGIVIIIALGVEVSMLAYQNHQLRTRLVDIQNSTLAQTPPSIEYLKPGARLKPISVYTPQGEEAKLTYQDYNKRYLVLVFTTTCPFCAATLPHWSDIVKAASGSSPNLEVIGVSLDDPKTTVQWLQAKKPPFRVVCAERNRFRDEYISSSVPQTILVEGDNDGGRVEKIWVGEPSASSLDEIKQSLGVISASVQ
ncbi:MAG TPA: TlpA disulfide reductase family protein [Rhodothermales bacterium]|nr:TlpA disulfide reductase family protein [Rhodothermales bacterium]